MVMMQVISMELYRNLALAIGCIFLTTWILLFNLWACLQVPTSPPGYSLLFNLWACLQVPTYPTTWILLFYLWACLQVPTPPPVYSSSTSGPASRYLPHHIIYFRTGNYLEYTVLNFQKLNRIQDPDPSFYVFTVYLGKILGILPDPNRQLCFVDHVFLDWVPFWFKSL